MPVNPSQAPNLSRTGTFKKDRQYTNARYNQGAEVLDTDLNDHQDYIQWGVNQYMKAAQGLPEDAIQAWEFVARPLTRDTAATHIGEHPRNSDNIALTLGRFPSRLGLVDTRAMAASTLLDAVAFDYKRLVDLAATVAEDHVYGNYLFKGAVTAAGAGETLQLIDENKNWTVDHKLLGLNFNTVVAGSGGGAIGSVDDAAVPATVLDSWEIDVSEPAARIVFLTGANAGQERAINSLVNSTTLSWTGALGSALAQGDTYVIVPGNALTTHRVAYDAAATEAASSPFGLAGVGVVMMWIHTFKDDVSPDEDSDIPHPSLLEDTTHRTQLRWCLRSAVLKTSDSTDAGRDAFHQVHLYNMAVNKTTGNGRLHTSNISDGEDGTGTPATPMDGFDLAQSFHQQNGAGAQAPKGWDIGPLNTSGVSRHHFHTGWAEGVDPTFTPIQLAIEDQFSDVDLHSAAPSVLLYTHQKHASLPTAVNLQTMSQYVYPDLPVSGTDNARLLLAGTAIAGLFRGFWVAPKRSLITPRQAAIETERARWFSWGYSTIWDTALNPNTNLGGFGPSRLVETTTPYEAPLVFQSMAAHMHFLDQWILGMTGLGNSMAGRHPLDTAGGIDPIPTNSIFFPTSQDVALTQAGQGANVFQGPAASLLNPDARLQGSVHMMDVLSGAGSPATSPVYTGSWIDGPGQYERRDGTSVAAADGLGWSFFSNQAADYPAPGSNTGRDFSVRGWHEGMGQAYQAQQALNFRKLAIKTMAHMQMDMFTISVKPPTVVSEATNPVGSGLGGPLGSKPYNYLEADGYAVSSLGAFRDNTELGANTNTPGQIIHSTYDGFKNSDSDSLPTPWNALPSPGEKEIGQTYGGGGSYAIERWNYNDAGPNQGIEGAVTMDAEKGAWGRWQVLPDNAAGGGDVTDAPELLDQWENRCTTMRLRYHIGDYYPGPNDSKGIPTNALVDTLNLFVRIEPLSLTHWMTLPKHQHTIMESSLNFTDALERALPYLVGAGDTSNLLSGTTPLVTSTSPDRFAAGVGATDDENLPFPYENQPFVHWYHPFMESLDAPYPYHDTPANYSAPRGSGRVVMYHKFGERSLVIPSIAYQDADGGTSSQDTVLVTGTDGPAPIDNWSQASGGANHTDNIGTHNNVSGGGAGVQRTLTVGGVGVTYSDNAPQFPFTPKEVGADFEADGFPGPIFLPAFRAFPKIDNVGAGHSDEGTNALFNATTAAMLATAGIGSEANYWPIIDETEYDNSSLPAGSGDWGTNFLWRLPVLRTAIRTDTVAAIVALIETTFASDWQAYVTGATINDIPGYEAANIASGEVTPASGPDQNFDSLFLGDVGTAIMKDSGNTVHRTMFGNPLLFGTVGNFLTGRPSFNADSRTDRIVRDVFELCEVERQDAFVTTGAAFLPLLNTWTALKDQGLQMKLLFNSSFRILHARPGGGFRPGATGGSLNHSSQPKSLTELFMVRNRTTGAAVAMPNAPDGPSDKPFLHLETMHPAAAGGSGFNVHPNNALVGHLYPMITDGVGGTSESAGSSDDLSDEAANPTHDWTDADFGALDTVKTGAHGDCVVGDPFDYEWSTHNATLLALTSKAPKRDRLHQNSGVEVDLISELRFARQNAAAHGLDQVGFNSLTWLDFMPSIGELAAPGDHEIQFVLYPGSYGQKMVDDTVPDGYNPPIAGCHLVASIEVNRPNEKTSSADNGDGQHYGESREVWNIMGHS